MQQDPRTTLPQLGKLLDSGEFRPLSERFGRELVARLLRERLAELRAAAQAGEPIARPSAPARLAREVTRRARELLAGRPR